VLQTAWRLSNPQACAKEKREKERGQQSAFHSTASMADVP